MKTHNKSQDILRRVWGNYGTLTADEYAILESEYGKPGGGNVTALEMALSNCGKLEQWIDDGEPRDRNWFLDLKF